jgi:peptide deformylase
VSSVFSGLRLSVKGYCLPETDVSLLGIKNRTIKLFNTCTKTVEEFKGVTSAAKKIGVSHSLVSMVLKGKRMQAGNYVLCPVSKE